MNTHNFDVDIVISSSNQKIKIDKDHIQVNNTSIACKDVKAIRYGVSLIGSVKKPKQKDYNIDVLDQNNKIISIKFNSNKVEELLEEDHTYYYVMSGVWQYVKKYLVNHYIEILNEKQEFEIGEAKVNHQGFMMTLTSGFFLWKKTKIELVPWNDLKYYLKKGILHIESISNKRKNISLSLHHDWNAVVLNTMMHYLWQEHRKEKLARGEKI
ncbi:MAG: hypothetical protein KJ712_02085 [Bacteroidetes bacterium]|nr:hypothetical protein [Bacteroidota bacterium]MBU1484814.1 hypothetical protein [Bacteroidota bacterium]MBU2045504.1 hypothetical protein [Bacteroidota bacterium]MBU2267746.1 hypothetical protein [Bacteroidota bacterium]MBU2377521.1 hypothetical protein [Bacteroidota bacterium]